MPNDFNADKALQTTTYTETFSSMAGGNQQITCKFSKYTQENLTAGGEILLITKSRGIITGELAVSNGSIMSIKTEKDVEKALPHVFESNQSNFKKVLVKHSLRQASPGDEDPIEPVPQLKFAKVVEAQLGPTVSLTGCTWLIYGMSDDNIKKLAIALLIVSGIAALIGTCGAAGVPMLAGITSKAFAASEAFGISGVLLYGGYFFAKRQSTPIDPINLTSAPQT